MRKKPPLWPGKGEMVLELAKQVPAAVESTASDAKKSLHVMAFLNLYNCLNYSYLYNLREVISRTDPDAFFRICFRVRG